MLYYINYFFIYFFFTHLKSPGDCIRPDPAPPTFGGGTGCEGTGVFVRHLDIDSSPGILKHSEEFVNC